MNISLSEWLLPEPPAGLVAIDHWHADVEQDDIRRKCRCAFNTAQTIGGCSGFTPEGTNERGERLSGVDIIIHDQDPPLQF